VVVSSSRGHQIEGASVQLTLGPGFAAQGTAVEQTVRYMHEGDGAYAASFNLAARDVGTNTYALQVEAEDHALYVRRLQSLNSSYDAEATHNNYYARCNEWGDCEVDPDRLIETFGSERVSFLLPPPERYMQKMTFRGRNHIFHPDISAVVHSFSRAPAYDNLIPKIVRAPARAQAIVHGRNRAAVGG
jgi:hypothetical protein